MQPSLFDEPLDEQPPDQAARDFAVDPAHHVVLEASAGTGKTRVLVDRYVRLIEAGVDPQHILAVTFTRKAAAEMRDRVLDTLRRRAAESPPMAARWAALRERIADIQISTIDAFCFSLLREFPLEAGVDPGFEIADETEMARFAAEALDLTLRASRAFLGADERVRLLFARVKAPVLREAIGALLDRRHVAYPAVAAFVRRQARVDSAADAGAAFVRRVRDRLAASPHRSALFDDGPMDSPEFRWLHADLASLDSFPDRDPSRVAQLDRRLERYFLRDDGKPRAQAAKRFTANQFPSPEARKRHNQAIQALAEGIAEARRALAADVNGLLARGLQRVLAVAIDKYETLLNEHAVLDFAAMLERSVGLLERQEEFARSRLKLQSRFHHLLVDEFQDTSRLQWRLVEQLIAAWGEGEGAADAPTSIFVVGDRKQSIYRFRHAEVTLLDEAARRISALRPGRSVRQAISHSFRAVPELLAFVNALSEAMQSDTALDERFRYDERDRFPVVSVSPGARRDGQPVLGLVAEPSVERCASAVAAEVERLLASAVVRDRNAAPRRARPDDVAILFRARAGHQYFESALEARGVRTYVYKGLGFFDAPEVQDLQALIRYLARPESDLRAAELLRSRIVRLSDPGLMSLAPACAEALTAPTFDLDRPGLSDLDRRLLARARASVARWLRMVDRVPPSTIVDAVLADSAYAYELGDHRRDQARENVKKLRLLVRRVESRGYLTLGRLAEYFERLRAGEESNAVIEAAGCVNLMTIHAAKGLEFPIVFVVNLQGQGRGRPSGFSVIERGPGGESEVAFTANEATALEDQREQEELRRLLYVAVTRARDRLYLAGVVHPEKGLKRAPRSLAGLLPDGLGQLFRLAAAPESAEVEWGSPQGTFAFRICRPLGAEEPRPSAAGGEPAEADLEPLSVPERGRVTATAVSAGAAGPADEGSAGRDQRLVGTIVHRLFQHRADAGRPLEELAALARELVRPEERVDVDDAAALSERVAAVFRQLAQRDDVKAALSGGEAHYEVPFSFRPTDRPDAVIRGSIDCLVVGPNRSCAILEFKTGAKRPEHEAQAAVYQRALQAAMPDRQIAAIIVYP